MRVIVVIALISCCVLATACANLSPEQPRTLMHEAAETCAEQFADIEVKGVTAAGRLIIGYGVVGQSYRGEFLTCYRARVRQAIHAQAAPGHLAASTSPTTQTTLPVRLQGDRVVVPVTLNQAQPASLIVDPQATKTLLSPVVLARLGGTIPPHARRWTVSLSGHAPLAVSLVRVQALSLGAVTLEELDVGVAPAWPAASDAEGVLGADVLERFRLTLDRAAQQLTLDV